MPRVLGETEKPEAKEDRTPIIIAVISALVLIIGVGVSLASSSNAISRETFFLLSAGLLLSALVLFAGLFYKPLAHYRAERRFAGREDRISRESLETFQSYVEGLRAICSVQRMDTVVFPLQNLKNSAEFSKLSDLHPWIYHVDTLTDQLAGLFNRTEVNKNTFTWAVDTFSSVLRLFNESLNRFVNEARLIAEQKPIPRHIREDYNTNRQGYIRYLDNYTAFVADLNKRFRSYKLNLPGGLGSTTEYAFRSVYAERPKEL